MKIYFCDGCNESVPLGEIQIGRVTTIKGKMFCSSCLPPGLLEAPRPSTAGAAPARASGAPLLTALVVILLALLAWQNRGLLLPSAANGGDALGGGEVSRSALADDVERLQATVLQLGADLDRTGREFTSLRSDFEVLRAADADHGRALDRLGEDIERLVQVQIEGGSVIERVHLLSSQNELIVKRLDALATAIEDHEVALSLGALAMSMGDGVTSTSVTPRTGDGAAAPKVDPQRQAILGELRRQLLDQAPDARYDAIEAVATGRYEELVPELLIRLEDDDMFVRMYAMEVLADFGAESAVGPLFAALDDGNPTIRRTAAESLVRLLGYDPGYDPKGSPNERKKAVEAWRAWYAGR